MAAKDKPVNGVRSLLIHYFNVSFRHEAVANVDAYDDGVFVPSLGLHMRGQRDGYYRVYSVEQYPNVGYYSIRSRPVDQGGLRFRVSLQRRGVLARLLLIGRGRRKLVYNLFLCFFRQISMQ